MIDACLQLITETEYVSVASVPKLCLLWGCTCEIQWNAQTGRVPRMLQHIHRIISGGTDAYNLKYISLLMSTRMLAATSLDYIHKKHLCPDYHRLASHTVSRKKVGGKAEECLLVKRETSVAKKKRLAAVEDGESCSTECRLARGRNTMRWLGVKCCKVCLP